MSSRPLIGLTGQQVKARDAQMFLGVLDNSAIDIFFADYAQAVIEAGGLPVYVPYGSDVDAVVENLDGVLMTGGDDINPSCYGQQRGPDTQASDDLRDDFEFAILAAAKRKELPLLGICRGLQVLNVATSGTINQHVPEHAFVDGPPDAIVHSVSFDPTSTLFRIYGASLEVNSLHHQSLAEIGSDLVVTGKSEDGSVEALEHRDLPMIGVQWHPEMMQGRAHDPIFTWLVQAATERSRR